MTLSRDSEFWRPQALIDKHEPFHLRSSNSLHKLIGATRFRYERVASTSASPRERLTSTYGLINDMATAQVVITKPSEDTPAVGDLFEGLSFFLVQRVPSRGSFIDKIRANGGNVVRLEAQADYVIADHYRKDCPAGSISYKFIDKAIESGELPDPQDHPAGPAHGAIRDVGSGAPSKGTRTPFTAEDDRVLWQWVERCKTEGQLVKGNEIYKQLEACNSRHPFQAWRDRYIKKLIHRPPAGVEVQVAANAPPSPPTAQDQEEMPAEGSARDRESYSQSRGARTRDVKMAEDELEDEEAEEDDPEEEGQEDEEQQPGMEQQDAEEQEVEEEEKPDFTQLDAGMLMKHGHDIEEIAEDQVEDAWEAWAKSNPEHSAAAWRDFWEKTVRPAYLKWRARKKQVQEQTREGSSGSEYNSLFDDKNGATDERQAADGEESQATPKRPGSSDSQKRKRKTPSSGTQTADIYKKQKVESTDDPRQRASTTEQPSERHATQTQYKARLSTQPIELLSDDDEGDDKEEEQEQPVPTSELNSAAQIQLQQEAVRRAGDTPPTSDVNRQAQTQLSQDVLRSRLGDQSYNTVSSSNFQTSEEIRAADHQLRRESVGEGDGEASRPSSSEKSYSQENGAGQSQAQHSASESLPQEHSHLLTEANLASQQAQHRAQLLRGTDLPKDDDERDGEAQDEYVQFLQNVTRSSLQGQETMAKPKDVQIAEVNSELPSAEMPLVNSQFEPPGFPELPMSSQQEIDEMLEDAIQWPESPVRSRQRETDASQNQSWQFETQVPYPQLPPLGAGVDEHRENLFSSQPAIAEAPNYPTLPEQLLQPSAAPAADARTPKFNEQDHGEPGVSQTGDVELEESSYVLVDDVSDLAQSQQEIDEDEIDLSVPEPEGGWGFSSSPAKLSSSQAEHSRPSQRQNATALQPIQDEDEEDVDSHDEIDLDVPEPEGGWELSSSPAKLRPSQVEQSSPSRRPKAAPLEPVEDVDRDEEDEDNDVAQDVVELSSSPSSSSSSSEADASIELTPSNNRQSHRRTAIETQDILDAETQQPDFDIPPPPDSDSESEEDLPSDPLQPPSSPPLAPTTTSTSQRPLAETQTLPDSDLNTYIDTMVVAHNYSEASVINALKCTSMRPELAELVLLLEKAGKGLPNDVAGVWSEEEDRVVEGSNARELKLLVEKHGWEEVEGRMRFLQDWREEDDDGEEE